MSAVFVMVSLEGATCSGMAAEQYVFSGVRRRSSKWRGVVMCVKKKQAVLEIFVIVKESVTKYRKRLRYVDPVNSVYVRSVRCSVSRIAVSENSQAELTCVVLAVR